MSDKLQVAFAVLAGYFLGRRRKLRTAAALAAAGLAGRASCGEGGPLAQGVKALGSTTEVQQLTDRLRGELVEIGKQAVVTAATRQIDSLSERLQERASGRRGAQAEQEEPGGEEDYEEEGAEEGAEEGTEEEGTEEESAEEEGAEEEGAEKAAERPARPRRRPVRTEERPERGKTQRRTRTARQAAQSRG
ncbi:hypothetical protein OUY22_05410 [Nonomuraea sp. MCN248]|uniref:Uncharacterized protein n=1 Tax=Nonomuraea corallina TaxID=2989783 RepID=A0ABT4S6M1_9ACTN|nr:hypothetical protein [Nonomuraea corallina]MDA0632848.1 hypothetical protein [Nonomuraea corallina]